ncbi:PREDICTED: beta-1,4-galactosyltransferase 2-like, partial [Rhagoletis zephyria]|uniref:beta-1,4-galactosyltransferase 2-like n=1 Tax=Rhagoletis zephyria TaxID=28612 RepID=UPI00081175B3
FRANQQQLPPPPAPIPQHFTGGLIQQQQSANYAVANSALAAAAVPYTYLNPSTSSSSSSSSLEEAVASFAVGNNSSLAIQLEAANSANSSSIKDSISNTTTAKSAAAAIMKSVAAPAGSNVLVNRDLQAMPSSVVVGGLVAASVDTVSEVANTVASSSSSSSFSVIVNSISNNGSSSSSSSSQVNKTSNSLNFSSKPPPPPPCPLIPSKLVGRLKVLRHAPPMTELEAQLADVQVGGRYRPADCTPQYKVAIIVPYRDRDEHLRTFLFNIHPMLMRQNIEYGIFIVEQSGSDRFNRAKLMNVGFLEARNHLDYDCFIFHDVDLIPEDDRNLYTCPEQPRHMSVAIDKFRYRLPYKDLFGGVSALTREQFETVNGFSNEFWGWGGEDDDMSNRVRHHKFKITRYKPEIARYTMLKHQQDAPSAERYKKLYNGWRRYDSDGINSTKYQVLDTSFKKLYTWILVDIFPPPMAKKKEEPKRSKQMAN